MANSEFLEVQENGLSIGLASPTPEFLLVPNIGVIGVGGAGGNAVNNMVMADLGDVSFFAANTDAQALSKSLVADKIQLGVTLTQGLGAGSNPEIGRAAAEEASEKIKEYLKGLHLLFITAGMGGGTGTGAAPVISKLAKDLGILTVGVVSKPFKFEGPKRMQTALSGIEELKKYVDTLIVIPNQNLFRIAQNGTLFTDAFKAADNVLCQGVRSITDLIINPGIINLDFADVKTVLSAMGRAVMGTGEAEGEDRAKVAVEQAIMNPLLDDSSIQGAKSVLINISGGSDLSLMEVDYVAERIRQEIQEDDANIKIGTCTDEVLHGKIRVSLVATGIDENPGRKYVPAAVEEKLTIVDVPASDNGLFDSPEPESAAQSAEEVFPLMQKAAETVAPPQPEPADYIQSPSFEETAETLAVDLTENPFSSISQPQLFSEEVPEIAPVIPVEEVPEIKEAVHLEAKTANADANVKTPRSLFDTLLPGFIGKQGRHRNTAANNTAAVSPKEPTLNIYPVESSKPAEKSNQTPFSDKNDFNDPFENVDLPAFLRR